MGVFKSIQKIPTKTSVQTKKHFNQTGEEGFIMIISLAIIPLLLCICFLLVAYSNYSYVSLTALNTCRKHLLTGQDKIRLEMIKLIDMNPRAKAMRKQVKQARKAVQNAKNPYAFAAATAYLLYVLGRQQLLAGEQKIHISKAKLYGLTYSAKLIKGLKKLNKDSKINVGDFPFALKSSPALSPTPDYEEKNNFVRQQKVEANWTMKNYNLKFINALINQASSPDIKGNCSASIDNEEGSKWRAILMKKGKL